MHDPNDPEKAPEEQRPENCAAAEGGFGPGGDEEPEEAFGAGILDPVGALAMVDVLEPAPDSQGHVDGTAVAGPAAGAPEGPAITRKTPTVLEAPEARSFEEFGLAPDVLEVLHSMGIYKATPIQELVIGPILAGSDVIGQAETGTGKTIGFGAPLVGRIDTARVAVQALVLTPTRELAQQVAGVIEKLGSGRNLGVALVVGGVHASGQILKLRSGSQVVVGTPGRVLDFLRERTLSLVWCETAVLDEADRMLDMGFIEDVGAILDHIPTERQTFLFSATIPPGVERLARRYMREPKTFATARGLATVSEIRQLYQEGEFRDKFRILRRVLDEAPEETCIIFCNTRRQAIDLDRMLWGHGYAAGALHGDQEQDVRFRILEAFRRREVKILVATDVASRGLDIEDIAKIINYEVPDEAESYVHRIGRTGRALRSGVAITLVAAKERYDWQKILQATGFTVERMAGGGPAHPHAPEAQSGEDRGGRGRRRDSGGHGRSDTSHRRAPARQGGRGDQRGRSDRSSAGGSHHQGPSHGRSADPPVHPPRPKEGSSAPPAKEGSPDHRERPPHSRDRQGAGGHSAGGHSASGEKKDSSSVDRRRRRGGRGRGGSKSGGGSGTA